MTYEAWNTGRLPDGARIMASPSSGETEAQRLEVVAAWNDLPDSLKAHPGLKRLYRALGGVNLDGTRGALAVAGAERCGTLSDCKQDKGSCLKAGYCLNRRANAGVPEVDRG